MAETFCSSWKRTKRTRSKRSQDDIDLAPSPKQKKPSAEEDEQEGEEVNAFDDPNGPRFEEDSDVAK